MAHIYPYTYFVDSVIEHSSAKVSVASSAVLYGLSVYTVFHVYVEDGEYYAFRLHEHYERLMRSCRIIGIDTFVGDWSYDTFVEAMSALLAANQPTTNVFVRASFHIDTELPGTRSRGLAAVLSAFVYDAEAILPDHDVKLGVSSWRRTPDISIPARAKVNGGYINSVLARQSAIDQGYDDAIFLDQAGHVTELSAANIFIVREGTIITPGHSADILEGINRRTIIELATAQNIPALERAIDRTELYVADEVFVTGTSAFIAQVASIDNRPVNHSSSVVDILRPLYLRALTDPSSSYLTRLGQR